MPADSPSCLACGTGVRPWFAKHTPWGDFPIQRCPGCRSAFVLPRPSLDQIVEIYRDAGAAAEASVEPRYLAALADERRNPSLTIDGRRIAAHLRALAPGSLVLDVGAGDGFHSQAMLAAGFQVEALEPSAAARGVFLRINGFEPQDCFLDLPFVESHSARYDAILLSQVLEHVVDLQQTVEFLYRLLRPAGIAAIAVPHFGSWLSALSGRRDMFITPPRHLNYFSLAGLQILLERRCFKLARSETVTWFDPQRIVRRLKSRPLGLAATAALKLFFYAADRCHRGNTLEAYFRKGP